MDIGQFFQRDHARANSLFEKLSDTSEGAVKTRERLFGQLKTELEAHAAAVEEVLYPVLKRHPETKDLVPAKREANDIDRTLRELDGMPKNDETFLKKLGEFKRVVERHLGEEEKKIGPALKKALREDEVDEIARKLSPEKRQELEDAASPQQESGQQARTEQDGRRDADRQQQQREAGGGQQRNGATGRAEAGADRAAQTGADAARRMAERQTEAVRQGATAAADAARRVTEQQADAVRQGATAAADAARRMTEQQAGAVRQGTTAAMEGARQVSGMIADQAQQASRGTVEATRTYGEMAQRTAEGIQALAKSSQVGAESLQQVQHAWMDLFNNAVRRGTQASQELLTCTSPQQIAEVQRRFVEESMREWFQASTSMMQLSSRIMGEMTRPLQEGATGPKRRR
jgi:hemerythrin superfamily protein